MVTVTRHLPDRPPSFARMEENWMTPRFYDALRARRAGKLLSVEGGTVALPSFALCASGQHHFDLPEAALVALAPLKYH